MKVRLCHSREKCRQIIIATAIGAACLVIGLIGPPPKTGQAEPPAYVFNHLATVPGPGPGTELFDLDFEPHSINAAGNVAFVADLVSASGSDIGEGVFASRSGQLLQIMGPGQPAPGGGTFANFELGFIGLNNAGDGAFVYVLEPFDPNILNAGLYRFSVIRPRPSAIVVPGVTPAPMPTGGVFAGVLQGASLNDRGDVVFGGIAPGLQLNGGPGFEGLGVGLFKANRANQIAPVVIPGDRAPGGKVFDDAWQGWPNNSGTIGFEAHLKGEECINVSITDSPLVCASTGVYRRSARGEIESIAHQGEPAPGGGLYRFAFGAVVNDVDDLVFIGDLTPPPGYLQTLGVFVNSHSKTTAVARPGDPMPGGGSFATASNFPYTARLNNRGEIAFIGRLDTRKNGASVDDTGLYVLWHGQLRLVARTSTVIPGIGTISQVNNPLFADAPGAAIFDEPAINDRGQIFFEATLTDGTAVLLVASPRGAE
jgi:hypothetical protein